MKNKSDFFKINLIYFVVMLGFVAMRILGCFNIPFFATTAGSYVPTLVIQIGIMFLLPLILYSIMFKSKPKNTFKDFKFNKISFKAILIAFGLGLCVFILNIFISSFFAIILDFFGYNYGSGSSISSEPTIVNLLINLTFVAVLPAFCEEFTHRGLLVKGMSALGAKKMILLTSLFFGLMHMNVNQFFYAAIIGVVLALVTLYSGSILPAMIIHFVNNAVSTYISFSSANNLPIGNFTHTISTFFKNSPALAIICIIVVFALALVCLLKLLRALFKECFSKKFEELRRESAIESLKNQLLGADHKVEEPMIDDLSGEQAIVFDEKIEIDGQNKFFKVKVPFEKLGFPVSPLVKPSLFDKIFFYVNIALGAAITIFTFVWGML